MSRAPRSLPRLPAALLRLAGRCWRTGWVRAVAGGLIGVVALLVFVRSVPLSAVLHHARPTSPGSLLAIGALMIVAQLARAARWRLIVRMWAPIGLLDALWLNAATQLLNYAVPVRAGEALRLWWFGHRTGQPAVTGLGVIVVDHAFDLTGVTAVLGIGATLKASASYLALPALSVLLVLLGLASSTLIAIGLCLWLGPMAGTLAGKRRVLPAAWLNRIARYRQSLDGSLTVLRGRRRLVGMFAVSALAVGADGGAFATLFHALGLQLPILSALVTQVALLYAQMLPSAPGYVGSVEAGGGVLLLSVGLSRATALGAITLWHAVTSVMIVGLGLVALQRLHRSSRRDAASAQSRLASWTRRPRRRMRALLRLRT